MKHIDLLNKKHCRWCSVVYYATKPVGKDGFCSKACKQALYRAWNKYVTAKMPASRVLSRS